MCLVPVVIVFFVSATARCCAFFDGLSYFTSRSAEHHSNTLKQVFSLFLRLLSPLLLNTVTVLTVLPTVSLTLFESYKEVNA